MTPVYIGEIVKRRPPAEKIERLEQLERVVHTTPVNNFDMSHWSCGTSRCALGNAAVDPWFKDRGLKLVDPFRVGARPYAYEAAMAFFGITATQSFLLFNPDEYPEGDVGPISQEAVIKRIRTLRNRIARAQKAAEQRVKEKLNASA